VITLAAFGRTYFERRGTPATSDDHSRLNRLTRFVLDGRPLGDKPLSAITEDDLELFFASLRTEGRAASTRNKYIQLVKPLFRWAAKKGYLARNPIADTDTIKREKHAQRDRRLVPDVVNDKGTITQEGEERRLLEAGWPLHHVQHMLGHANLAQTSTYLNATRIGCTKACGASRQFPPVAIRLQRMRGSSTG
jgi:site-specific recombinase XerD